MKICQLQTKKFYNMGTRAKSKLVIVCNEEYVDRFIPRNEYSNNNALRITVTGMKSNLLKQTGRNLLFRKIFYLRSQ